MPTPKSHKAENFLTGNGSEDKTESNKDDSRNSKGLNGCGDDKPTTVHAPVVVHSKMEKQESKSAQSKQKSRLSVSNENNILIDPDVLSDFQTQALILTILVCI